jgi:hypothetical protein
MTIINKGNNMLKKALILFGLVYIALAIWGIMLELQGGHHDGSLLLGTFKLDFVHNLVHLLSGVVALTALVASERYARLYFQVFGVIYGLVAILGFIQSDTVLGLFVVNMPDNFLHVAIAVASLALGFFTKKPASSSTPIPPSAPPATPPSTSPPAPAGQ